MALINEIYKQINAETEQCMATRPKKIRLRSRESFRAECYAEAYARHLPELQAEQAQNASFEDLINSNTISAADQLKKNQVITLSVIIIVSIILYYTFKN